MENSTEQWVYRIDLTYENLRDMPLHEIKAIIKEHRERLWQAQKEKNALISGILQTQRLIQLEKT